MKRNTILYLVLALVLVAGPLLWILTDEAPSAPPPKWPAATSSSSSRGAGRSVLASRTASGSPSNPEKPADDVETVAQVVEKPTAPLVRVLLRITLDGLDPEIPAADSVVVVARERTESRKDRRESDDGLTCTSDGGRAPVFDVDVSPLVPEGARWAGLQISLDRAGYLPAVTRTTAWSPERGVKEPAVVPVRVTLRAAGFAAGVVQDERFARVCAAAMGSFIDLGRGWTRVDETRTDAKGEYRLRLVPGQANLVIAAAEGLEPGSLNVTGVARAESTISPFTLLPGLAFSGTIRYADGRPVPHAGVVAMPIWGKPEIWLGGHGLCYRGGRILEAPAGAAASTDLFRVCGLTSGDYDVGITAADISSDLLATFSRRASPPMEGLAFVVDGGQVVIEATCDGRPVPRLAISVGNLVGGVSTKTDARGVARVLVVPGSRYDIAHGGRCFDPEPRAVVGPPIGKEARVALALRLRPSTLRVTLRPEDGSGSHAVTSADLQLYAIEEPPSTLPDRSETLTFDRGAAEVTALWAGAYRLVAIPRPDSFRLPAETTVSLREADVTATELRFPHGGWVRVRVRDAEGKPTAAHFRVLGPDDAEIAAGDANSEPGALVRPGEHRVEVVVPGQEPRRLEALRVRAYLTTTFDLNL